MRSAKRAPDKHPPFRFPRRTIGAWVLMLSITWSLVTVQLATLSRRAVLHSVPICAYAVGAPRAHAASPSLEFLTASSGLQWADAKVGSGPAFQKGQRVAIDYVMSTTGARYGSKIDSTKDRNAPYSWTLGDGSTILGLEEAILGGEGVPPMLPGGVRRVIVPSKLAYADLAKPNKNGLQFQDCSTGRGPIPPQEPQSSGDMGAGEFQRFKNICTNPRRSNAPLPFLPPKETVPARVSPVILTPRDMLLDIARVDSRPSKTAMRIGRINPTSCWTSSSSGKGVEQRKLNRTHTSRLLFTIRGFF